MATIKVNQASIDELKSAVTFSAEQASQAAELVAKAVNGISGMSFAAKYGLESDLTGLKNRLNKQAQLGRTCCRAVQETVDALVQVDEGAGSSARGAWNGTSALAGAVLAGTVPRGLPLAIEELLKKVSEIIRDCTEGTPGTGSARTPNIDGSNQGSGSGYQNQLPDWAKEYDDIYSERVPASDGGWHLIATNNLNGSVSCTFYTMRKLRERGLGFPFQSSKVSYNGSEWFGNCTSDVPKAAGADAIETLLSGRDSLENVVVSFPPSANTGNCGHVMLIDKVYKDSSTGQTMVSFSDNYDYETNQILYDAKGYSNVSTWTLDMFKQKHINFHGGITGAVLIGS